MRQNKVVLLGCKNYESELIHEKVSLAFKLIGGIEKFIGENESVFVKVNALLPSPPEKAVTTHPEVVKAVVKEIMRVTSNVTIGDSPGGPFTRSMLKRVYEGCGYTDVANETGASLSYDTSIVQKSVPDGKALKSVTLCGAVSKADKVVSISKWKTHMLMGITGAIKNSFGAVPGMNKITYHSRFSREKDFAELLVDVSLACGACLHFVDAITGMDGNGPRKGRIKQIGAIAAGENPFAVDAAIMALIGQEPEKNKPLAAAIERGIYNEDSLEILGDNIDSLRIKDFRMPDKKQLSSRIPPSIMDVFGRWLALKPAPIKGKCTGCGRCVSICPASAIKIENDFAIFDARKCIRCYCCEELCEQEAIELVRPPVFRALSRFGGG